MHAILSQYSGHEQQKIAQKFEDIQIHFDSLHDRVKSVGIRLEEINKREKMNHEVVTKRIEEFEHTMERSFDNLRDALQPARILEALRPALEAGLRDISTHVEERLQEGLRRRASLLDKLEAEPLVEQDGRAGSSEAEAEIADEPLEGAQEEVEDAAATQNSCQHLDREGIDRRHDDLEFRLSQLSLFMHDLSQQFDDFRAEAELAKRAEHVPAHADKLSQWYERSDAPTTLAAAGGAALSDATTRASPTRESTSLSDGEAQVRALPEMGTHFGMRQRADVPKLDSAEVGVDFFGRAARHRFPGSLPACCARASGASAACAGASVSVRLGGANAARTGASGSGGGVGSYGRDLCFSEAAGDGAHVHLSVAALAPDAPPHFSFLSVTEIMYLFAL
eukprot:TRINITY_DN17492_c0_g2_i1.p1 TRINITY_DN17492_c0_g2~~TRINITY_DN17492_c0_g2_i1.p1  ORF type:complete len:412 (+),score=82.49 TRINITY_DN17492_c0_g2_i1:56-1237(+)